MRSGKIAAGELLANAAVSVRAGVATESVLELMPAERWDFDVRGATDRGWIDCVVREPDGAVVTLLRQAPIFSGTSCVLSVLVPPGTYGVLIRQGRRQASVMARAGGGVAVVELKE
jgi:hypothetical protein